MVGPARLLGFLDRYIEWLDTGVAGIPGVGQLALMLPKIVLMLLMAKMLVDTANKLSPADHLT